MTQVRWGLLSTAAIGATKLLASDEVDAVYVALPVSMHTEWTVKALEAGKHVLCEKPFATNGADAERAFAAAEAADRMCVEGFMWRHHPQTEYARRLLDDGAIGRLLLVRTALTVDVPEGDIRRTRSGGGGALGDLGCYCVSGTRYLGEDPDAVYRLEFERVSAAIASGAPLPHGRDDAVAQAAVLEAPATSARAGKPIETRRSGATA